ncbi:MAG: replication factor C large subunit [Candidatus Atabeyarchaeum deiterrae]
MSSTPAAKAPLNSIIWADKYSPMRISEILGNAEAVSKIVKWLSTWSTGRIPEKRAILLSGPTGTGKTAMAYAIANESGYELVEVNASDKRDKETVRKVIGSSAAMPSLLGGTKGRILLIDEVDGLSGDEDRGGVSAMIEAIKETTSPIILTANDKWDTKIRSLQSLCIDVEVRRIQASTIINALSRICQEEGVKTNLEALKLIAENSSGDLRSAINDLQAIAEGRNEITLEDVGNISARRDRVKGTFDGLRAMFHSENLRQAVSSVESLDMDQDMIIQWIYENIPKEFADPSELSQAFYMLSRADIFLGRIRKNQDWGLLSYVYELMSGGVALARKIPSKRFVTYSFPNYIKALSATRSRRTAQKEVCLKLGAKSHESAREILHEYLPTIKTIIENNPRAATEFIKWFDLAEEDVSTITGGKKIKVMKAEPTKTAERKKKVSAETPQQTKQTHLF